MARRSYKPVKGLQQIARYTADGLGIQVWRSGLQRTREDEHAPYVTGQVRAWAGQEPGQPKVGVVRFVDRSGNAWALWCALEGCWQIEAALCVDHETGGAEWKLPIPGALRITPGMAQALDLGSPCA